MNNRNLSDLLRKVRVPEPPQAYWENFPGDVTRIARTSASSEPVPQVAVSFLGRSWRPALIACATTCIIIVFIFGSKFLNKPHPDNSLAKVERCLQEVQTMFPDQVRAIIFEGNNTRLMLSDAPDVHGSLPVYLKICDQHGCERIVTFSGQRVPIKGELCDVLVDSKQNVLVVGDRKFWPGGMPGELRVEAKAL